MLLYFQDIPTSPSARVSESDSVAPSSVGGGGGGQRRANRNLAAELPSSPGRDLPAFENEEDDILGDGGDGDLAMDEVYACDLMDICMETGIDFARAQVEAGADTIGIGDAIASLSISLLNTEDGSVALAPQVVASLSGQDRLTCNR